MKNLLMKVVALRRLAAQWGFVYPSVWKHLAALRGEIDELTLEVSRLASEVTTLAKEDGFSPQMPPTMGRFNEYWNLAKKGEI